MGRHLQFGLFASLFLLTSWIVHLTNIFLPSLARISTNARARHARYAPPGGARPSSSPPWTTDRTARRTRSTTAAQRVRRREGTVASSTSRRGPARAGRSSSTRRRSGGGRTRWGTRSTSSDGSAPLRVARDFCGGRLYTCPTRATIGCLMFIDLLVVNVSYI